MEKVRKTVTKLLLHLPESESCSVLVGDNKRTENGDFTVSEGRDWLLVSGSGACCHIQSDLVSLIASWWQSCGVLGLNSQMLIINGCLLPIMTNTWSNQQIKRTGLG